ncbi:MAG: hypothetical protein AB7W16_10580 [Candidatus Obscuribacterales bacterium]
MEGLEYSDEILTETFLEGTKISEREAMLLQRAFADGRCDAKDVVALLGFYELRYFDSRAYELDRQMLILWMIQKMHSHPFLFQRLPQPIKSVDPKFYRKLKTAWRRNCKSSECTMQTLMNASSHLMKDDLKLAREYFSIAQEQEPDNPKLPILISRLEHAEHITNE